MIENGQIFKILKKWITRSRSDCGSSGEFESMGMDNTISAFAMILTAFVFAGVVLLMEIAFRYSKLVIKI
jgi:hypothetical protein